MIFMDLSFANNYDLLSQIGFIITLIDKDNKANILYQLSIKYKRVTQSVLVSKLYRIAYGFDTGAVIKVTIKKILQLKRLLITLYTDLKSLYNYLVKLRTI